MHKKKQTGSLLSKRAVSILSSPIFALVMAIATILALFGEDFNACCLEPENDGIIDLVFVIVFFLFLSEFVGQVWFVPSYRLGFYFWLDLCTVISLIPNLPWVSELLFEFFGGDEKETEGNFTLARAGRAALTGSRASRLLRLIRILRWVRIMPRIIKFFEVVLQRRQLKRREKYDRDFGLEQEGVEPSKVGERVSELVTRKVVIGVMLILVAIPLLQPPSTTFHTSSLERNIDDLASFWTCCNTTLYPEKLSDFLIDHEDLLFLSVHDIIEYDNEAKIDDLRFSEIVDVEASGGLARFNDKDRIVHESTMEILSTIFILVLLGTGTLMFNNDTTRLFIAPIQRMTRIIHKLAENPLAASTLTASECMSEYETSLLEGALIRISRLLRVGFGDAGKEVVQIDTKGAIDIRTEGQYVEAVFVYFRIRQCNVAATALEEDVFILLNMVALAVHTAVKEHGGIPVSTSGDGFLAAWVFRDGLVSALTSGDAGRALAAAMQAMQTISSSAQKGEIEWLCRRQKDFKLEVGIGLHAGWAVLGAVGSEFKVDAVFVSPTVSVTQSLADASSVYDVQFLFTEDVHVLLPPEVQPLCRVVDKVWCQGFEGNIFTYDTEWSDRAVTVHAEMTTDADATDAACTFAVPSTSRGFRMRYADAVKSYITGNWDDAAEQLRLLLASHPRDGPSRELLLYMRSG
eukprot:Rmarinus@m.15834